MHSTGNVTFSWFSVPGIVIWTVGCSQREQSDPHGKQMHRSASVGTCSRCVLLGGQVPVICYAVVRCVTSTVGHDGSGYLTATRSSD
jgi:hypothetical protein